MGRTLRFLVTILVLLCSALSARAAQGAALERGTAITDPLALRELDRGRFSLARVILPSASADIPPLTNSQFFALPTMTLVRKVLDEEFDRYVARHKANLPNETIGVGTYSIFNCSIAPSFTHPTPASSWQVSSIGWIVPISPRITAGKSG